MGQLLRNPYTTGPEVYWQQAAPAVYVNLCSDPLQHGPDGNW